MKIPRKIDDRLKNSIVQIQFDSLLPFGTILGYFHSIFKEKLKFLPQRTPILSNGKIIGVEESAPIIITEDDNFTIVIQDNSITFDLLNGYKGWDVYQKNIINYLTPLFNEKLIEKINQIGVRYISNFDDIYIYEHINATIQLGFTNNRIKGQSKFEFTIDNKIVLLNLLNGGGVVDSESTNTPRVGSIIDIDIIQRQPSVNSIAELINTIGDIHEIEKKVFFSLLKDSFLTTLNPIY